MEEVLLTQLHDFVVQPVEQLLVALLHSRSDGVLIAEFGDADLESLVGLGPSQYLGIVGGESVATTIEQRIVGIGVLVVLLQLDVGLVLLEVAFGGGTLGDDQRLALELVHVSDFGIFRGDHAERHLHVRLGEIDFFLTLVGDGEVGQRDVHLVGGEHVHAGGWIDGSVLDLHSQILTETLGEVHVVAGVFAFLVDVAERGLVGEDGNLELAGLLDLVQSAGGGATAGAGIATSGALIARSGRGRTASSHRGCHDQRGRCGHDALECFVDD